MVGRRGLFARNDNKNEKYMVVGERFYVFKRSYEIINRNRNDGKDERWILLNSDVRDEPKNRMKKNGNNK